jgi:hypothetical protein
MPRIGFIVSDFKLEAIEMIHQRHGDAWVPVPQYADIPRPRFAAEIGAETVDRQDRRRRAAVP